MEEHNYNGMTDFPIVAEPEWKSKTCPECGETWNVWCAECLDCGRSLADVEAIPDPEFAEESRENMEHFAEGMNKAQQYFTVTVAERQYGGMQFFVRPRVVISGWGDTEAQKAFGKSLAEVKSGREAAKAVVTEMLLDAMDSFTVVKLADPVPAK